MDDKIISIKKKVSKTEIVYDGISDTNVIIDDDNDSSNRSGNSQQNSLKNRSIRYSLFDKLNDQKKQINSRVLDILNANDEKEKNIISNFDDISRSPSNLNEENKKIRRGSTGGLVRSSSSGGLERNNSSGSLNDLQEGNQLSSRKKRNRLQEKSFLDESRHSMHSMDSGHSNEEKGQDYKGSVKGSVKGSGDGSQKDHRINGSVSRKTEDENERAASSRLAFANADRRLESKVISLRHSYSKATNMKVYSKATNMKENIFSTTIFSPISCDSNFYSNWNFFMILLTLVTSIYTPYRISFETDSSKSYYMILEGFELAFDIIFIINMLAHAFHFYRPDKMSTHIEDNSIEFRFEVLTHYLTRNSGRRFMLDILSSMPWDYIASSSDKNDLSLQFGLGLLRTLRLVWVYEFFQKCEANVNIPFFTLRTVKLLMFLLLETHWFACLFYFIGFTETDSTESWLFYVENNKMNGLPDSSIQRYLISLYWSWVTCATLGYGDITPQTSREMVIVIFYTAFNILFSAYVVANMTSIVSSESESTKEFRHKYKSLCKFVSVNMIPVEIGAAMKAHMLLQYNASGEHREILDEVPEHLKTRVQHFLYRPIIENAIFSEFVTDTFIDNLSCSFRLEVVMPGSDLIIQDDGSHEMYFIVSGSADLMHLSMVESPNDEIEDEFENIDIPKRKSLTDILKSFDLESIRSKTKNYRKVKKYHISSYGIGSAIGEVSFFFNLLQPFSVRTTKLSRLLVLKRDAWQKLEVAFPVDATLCKKSSLSNILEQINQYREPGHTFTSNPAVDREIMDIYNDLERDIQYSESQWEHDKVADLCLASAADNVVVIKRILNCGINVNSSDYDKRTPLMVAASKGSLNALRYLLDKGADFQPIDVFGNTALYEAVRHGHDTCASVLFEQGARLSDSINVHAAGSMLCTIISKGEHSGLMRLIQYGLHVDSGDYDQRRALHIAAACGDFRSVKILLDHRAESSCLDNFGRTPLLEAIRANHTSVAKLLFDRGAKLGFIETERMDVKLERDILLSKSDTTWKGRILASSELVNCVSKLDSNYLRLLLQFGANPNKAFDYDLRSPAHLAVCMNSVEMCTILLEFKADFFSDQSKDRWGNTPSDDAKKYGYTWLNDVIQNLNRIANSEEIVDI